MGQGKQGALRFWRNVFYKITSVSPGQQNPLHTNPQRSRRVPAQHSTSSRPPHWGEDAPFPFTTTTFSSPAQRLRLRWKQTGTKWGGLPMRKPQGQTSRRPLGYKLAPASLPHSLEPSRHLPPADLRLRPRLRLRVTAPPARAAVSLPHFQHRFCYPISRRHGCVAQSGGRRGEGGFPHGLASTTPSQTPLLVFLTLTFFGESAFTEVTSVCLETVW